MASRLIRVPIATLFSRTHRIFWWCSLSTFWAALWLPGGIYVPLAIAVLGYASAIADLFHNLGSALEGTVVEVSNPLRSISLHRKGFGVGLLGVLLTLTPIGPHVSLFFTQLIVKPVAWHMWAVEPMPPTSGFGNEPIRLVGPYLCRVSNTPSGLGLYVIGGGVIGLTEDSKGKPVWFINPYPIAPFRVLFGM